MTAKVRWILILALATGTSIAATAARTPEADPPAPTAAASSLDDLFRQLDIPFSTSGNNWYKVFYPTDNGGTLRLLFNSRSLGTLTDGTTLTSVVLFASVATLPEGFTPSAAFLKKLSDINNDLSMGKVTYVGGQASGIFYQSAFWLNDATINTLGFQLLFADHIIPQIEKELRPFLAG